MKKFAIALCVITIIVALCAIGYSAETWLMVNRPELLCETYPLAGMVTEIDRECDVVYFVDGAGLEWSFFGAEDWDIGDFVACIMADTGIENYIYDDMMVTIRYAGNISFYAD